jgi:hypothetical protein
MSGFQHDIAGGNGDFIIPQLQSPNFSIAGETGWAILKNGDAYFFNVTAEGSITTSSVIIEGSTGNILIYSGTPSTGDLVGSWAGAAGSDGHSNSYPAALCVGLASGPQIQIGLNGSNAGIVRINMGSSSFLGGEVNGDVIGSPTYASMGIIGPASTAAGHGDYVEEAFNSANSSGTSTANWQIYYVDTTGAGHLVAVVNSSGWTFAGPVTFDSSVTFNGFVTFNDGASISGGLTVDTINGSSDTGTGLPGGTPTGGPNSGSFAGHTHDFDGHTHAI